MLLLFFQIFKKRSRETSDYKKGQISFFFFQLNHQLCRPLKDTKIRLQTRTLVMFRHGNVVMAYNGHRLSRFAFNFPDAQKELENNKTKQKVEISIS